MAGWNDSVARSRATVYDLDVPSANPKRYTNSMVLSLTGTPG